MTHSYHHKKKKIVILGAGFAGMGIYRQLVRSMAPSERAKYSIVIVNKTNHFLFSPMLHEVATGNIEQNHIVEPIAALNSQKMPFEFIQAAVDTINFDQQVVRTDHNDVAYDYLCIAMGATTQYHGVPGGEEYAYPLKTLNDAMYLRNRCIDLFTEAAHETDRDQRQKMLSFVIVGGGPTGVEFAAELAELCYDTLQPYYKNVIHQSDIHISVVNSSDCLLRGFHTGLSRRAAKVLRKKKIHIYQNTLVKHVHDDHVVLSSGEQLQAMTTVWAAGVKPQPITYTPAIKVTGALRIITEPTMQVAEYKNVFALGDIATPEFAEGERPLPMLAQVAQQQGKLVGKNIVHMIRDEDLELFRFRKKGNLASLGQGNAVADIFGIKFKGVLAWFIWRTVYLFQFHSWRKRIKIMLDWTINLFTKRDITRIERKYP